MDIEPKKGDKLVMSEKINKALEKSERIGVIGSPSSTSGLTIDILGTAVTKRLVGNLSIFNYIQESNDHYALGQITEITMENIWAQDPTMRGLIRQKGRVDPITERQDIHTANMIISSVFRKENNVLEPSILGTIPSTGTSIKLIDENVMDILLEDYKDELFYLGNIYGTNIKMPMWLKHFGSQKDNHGAGEVYHIGVFGKTGSGKSVLARMMMLGYARHKNMSIFVLDPQGEFARDIKNKANILHVIEKNIGRKIEIYDLHDVVLTGYELFKKILVHSGFFQELGIIHQTNREQAARQVQLALEKKEVRQNALDSYDRDEKKLTGSIAPFDAYKREAFDKVWNALSDDTVLSRIYTSKELKERVKSIYDSSNADDMYRLWRRIANLFRYEPGKSIKINDLVEKISLEQGAITIIDLSETDVPKDVYWNDSMRFVVIGEFLKKIIGEAENAYKSNNQLNCLVVIDEAHRLAPRENTEDEDKQKVKVLLEDAIRTTRKYGLGWMFISQTLSSLSREIINQIRIYVFGFGLAWGIERQALHDIIGGDLESFKLYQMFRDPQSSLGKPEFPFMTKGPISPLSFSGTPLFFTALDYPDEFVNMNFSSNTNKNTSFDNKETHDKFNEL
jgi:hypothetical protein